MKIILCILQLFGTANEPILPSNGRVSSVTLMHLNFTVTQNKILWNIILSNYSLVCVRYGAVEWRTEKTRSYPFYRPSLAATITPLCYHYL